MPLAMQARRWLRPFSAITDCTTISLYDICQGVGHQSQIGMHALEPAVLLLQFTQLGQVRDDKP
jgi:hypothetical protein